MNYVGIFESYCGGAEIFLCGRNVQLVLDSEGGIDTDGLDRPVKPCPDLDYTVKLLLCVTLFEDPAACVEIAKKHTIHEITTAYANGEDSISGVCFLDALEDEEWEGDELVDLYDKVEQRLLNGEEVDLSDELGYDTFKLSIEEVAGSNYHFDTTEWQHLMDEEF